MKMKRRFQNGFSLVEIVAVIAVIGILSAIIFVSYNGIQSRMSDTYVNADVESVFSKELKYIADNSSAKSYYSGNGYDSALGFKAGSGNVIDVVVDGTDYCVRGYNAKGTKNSISNAYEKESSPGVCDDLGPSSEVNGGLLTWKQISAGGYHTCAVASNDNAYCWGEDQSDRGNLGDNTMSDRWVPTPVYTGSGSGLNGLTVKSVDASWWRHSCAIASNDDVYCWGDNEYAQLGINTSGAGTSSLMPVAVNTTNNNSLGQTNALIGNKPVTAIDAGAYHTCAVTDEEKVVCWAQDWTGLLGDGGGVTTELVPTNVDTSGVLSGKTVMAMAIGEYHTCVIANEDGKVYCWGWDDRGQLGDNQVGDGIYAVSPQAINMTNGVSALYGKTAKAISVGDRHTCVIANEDNWVYCWGYNGYGQIGDGTWSNNRLVATRMIDGNGVLSGKTIKSISLGVYHTCVIASDDKAYCWGNSEYGQLGYGPGGSSEYPVAVDTTNLPGDGTVLAISAGWDHTCAIASDHQIYCWGANEEGQLGNNTTSPSDIPVAATQTTE